MSFLYTLFLSLFFVSYLPFFFFEYFKKGKYKGKLKEKLGLKSYIFKSGQPTLWVHAVSVGEIKAASSLLRKFKKDFPNSSLIISSTTQTGNTEAMRCCPQADHHVIMPLDFKGRIKKLLKSLDRLDIFLLV